MAFIRSILIARGLGVDVFGKYVLIVALVGTIQEFCNLNIYTALVKFGTDYREAGRTDEFVALLKVCLVVCSVTVILSILVVVLGSSLATRTFQEISEYSGYLVAYAAASGAMFFNSIGASVLRMFYKFKLNAFIQIGVASFNLIVVAVVLGLYPGQLGPFITAMIIVTLFDVVVVNAVAAVEVYSDVKLHIHAKMNLIKGEIKAIRNFALSNSGSRTLVNLLSKGDVLLLGVFSGASQIGQYEVGKKLAQTFSRLTEPSLISVYPQLASLTAKKEKGEIKTLIRRTSVLILVPAVIVFLLAIVGGEFAISTLFGEEFEQALHPFWIHLVIIIIEGVFFWSRPLIYSLGKVHARLIVMIIALLIGGLSGFSLGPLYGPVGIAFSLLITKTFVVSALTTISWKALRKL